MQIHDRVVDTLVAVDDGVRVKTHDQVFAQLGALLKKILKFVSGYLWPILYISFRIEKILSFFLQQKRPTNVVWKHFIKRQNNLV